MCVSVCTRWVLTGALTWAGSCELGGVSCALALPCRTSRWERLIPFARDLFADVRSKQPMMGLKKQDADLNVFVDGTSLGRKGLWCCEFAWAANLVAGYHTHQSIHHANRAPEKRIA